LEDRGNTENPKKKKTPERCAEIVEAAQRTQSVANHHYKLCELSEAVSRDALSLPK
jgi:hypothetical protein